MSIAASPERVAQVWQLLRSMADWEPSPKVATPRGAQPGEAGVLHEPCDVCDGSGRLKSSALCRRCKGRGYLTVDPQTRREAPEAKDPDDFSTSPRELALAVRYRRVRCDRCGGKPHPERGCPGCAGSGRVDVLDTRQTDASLRRLERDWPQLRTGENGEEPGWWLSAALDRKLAQWTTGSYPELAQLLQRLELERPDVVTTLERWVIRPALDPTLADPSPATRALINEFVEWLAERMPWPIRVPTRPQRDWLEAKHDLWRSRGNDRARLQRDQEIATLVAAGETVVTVAQAFALSPKRVRQIVATAPNVATSAA